MTNGLPSVEMPFEGSVGLRTIGDPSMYTMVRLALFTTATCIQRPTGSAWLHDVGSASWSVGYTTNCRNRSGDRFRLQVGSSGDQPLLLPASPLRPSQLR